MNKNRLIAFFACLTAVIILPVAAQQSGELELNLEQFPEQGTEPETGGDLKLNLEQFENGDKEGELELNLEQFGNNDGQNNQTQSPAAPATETKPNLEQFDQSTSAAETPAGKSRSLFSGNGLYLFIGAALLLLLIFTLRRRR